MHFATATLNLAAEDRLVMLRDGALEALPERTLPQKESALLEAVRRNDAARDPWRELPLAQGEDAHGPDDITCLMVTGD